MRPGKKMRTGERIFISEELSAEILGRGEFGERTVRLRPSGDLFEVLDRVGHVPLPPYIRRADTGADRERYQTVFARERGIGGGSDGGAAFLRREILEGVSRGGGCDGAGDAACGVGDVCAAAGAGD